PKARVLPANDKNILVAIVVKIHPRGTVSSGSQHTRHLLRESSVAVVVADGCKARLGDEDVRSSVIIRVAPAHAAGIEAAKTAGDLRKLAIAVISVDDNCCGIARGYL